MIYNVVLVSGVQQSDSVIHIHVSIIFQILLPFRLLQNIELYRRSLLVIYFKYSSVYMSVPNSQSILPPHLSPLVTISLFSKSMSLSLFCK